MILQNIQKLIGLVDTITLTRDGQIAFNEEIAGLKHYYAPKHPEDCDPKFMGQVFSIRFYRD